MVCVFVQPYFGGASMPEPSSAVARSRLENPRVLPAPPFSSRDKD